MKDSELLTFFDIHKDGNLHITHPVNVKIFSAPITLGELFRMFELAHERNENAVRQD